MLLVLTAFSAVAQRPADRGEVVQGTIRRADGTALAGATVVVTAIPTTESRTDESTHDGSVTVRFATGTGNYIIRVSAPGFETARQRLLHDEGRRNDSTLTFVVTLSAAKATQLAAVSVVAPRRQRLGVRGDAPDVGARIDDNIAALNPLERGDFNSMAASVPGIVAIDQNGTRGFSTLGLGVDDNRIRLNGLTFGSADIPTATRASVRLQTTAFDAAIGGFSGALLDATVSPGSNAPNGSIEATLDQPSLQATDRIGRNVGASFSQLRLGGYRSGALSRDKVFANASVQFNRRVSDAASLASVPPDVLALSGAAPGAAERFLAILDSLQIPRGAGGVPASITDQHGSALVRLDLFPTSTRALNALVSADLRRVSPSQLNPHALPTTSGRASANTMSAQLEFARYIHEFVLVRARSGLGFHSTSATPESQGPAGIVLSDAPSSSLPSTVTALSFGGNVVLPHREDGWSWQGTMEGAWFSPSNRHQPKITAGTIVEGLSETDGANTNGTFLYNSLTDLAAAHPASFTRALSASVWRSRQVSGWLSLGDIWRATPSFTLQYGLRGEAGRYLDRPARNVIADSAFGLRTSIVPDGWSLLPRVGFRWNYGSTSRVSLFGPSARGTIHGGFGAFRSALPVGLPGSAIAATGLSGSPLTLRCAGPAVPSAQWSLYSLYAAGSQPIPDSCAGGQSLFGERAQRIVAFAPGYAPSLAWRSNIGWSGSVLSMHTTADLAYSANSHLPGTVDRNLVERAPFALPNEGGRAIYVASDQIDPFTGTSSPPASRIRGLASQVIELATQGQSRASQLALSLSPVSGLFVTRFWTLSYVLSRVQDRVLGRDGGTSGDPRVLGAWSPATTDARHMVAGSFAWLFGDGVWLRVGMQLRSGIPFTPRVLGDVNGDGAPDDLPFVFDPARAPDAAMSAGLSRLLQQSPSADCLLRQIGSVTARNSCRGPWTSSTNAQMTFDGPSVRLSHRATLSVTTSNLLAGVDVLVHGSGNLRGWGQTSAPDPVLYAVRSYDPTTRSFHYAVNSQFGQSGPSFSFYRSPFTLTVGATITLGASGPEQLANDLMATGRSRNGERLTAAQFASSFSQSGIIDPIPAILAARDSLLLSAGQLAAIAQLRASYIAQSDSVWGKLGHELADLGTTYDRGYVLQRVHAARLQAYDLLAQAARELRARLTSDQYALLGPDLIQLLDDSAIERLKRVDARSY
ncbi:MAG: carboxypeptidase-like regulatory domain-containing protein [bacterium]